MMSLIDFILNLFRDQQAAAEYIANPQQALFEAGLGNVAPAQLASVAATAVPSVALGQGDPVIGLQRAVSNQWGFEPVYAPQRVFAPETNTDLLSGNRTDLASHNTTDLASHNNVPLLSPNQDAGANAQQGAFNLGFGDITLGNKTTANGDGAVAIGDDNDGDILTGDGSALGNGNDVDNTDVRTGDDAIVVAGDRNDVDQGSTRVDGDYTTTHDGTVIQTSGHGTSSSSQGNTTLVDGNQSSTTVIGSDNHAGSVLADADTTTVTTTTTTTSVDDNSVDYDYTSVQHTTVADSYNGSYNDVGSYNDSVDYTSTTVDNTDYSQSTTVTDSYNTDNSVQDSLVLTNDQSASLDAF